MGEAFDYSAAVLNISMDDFLDMFIVSGIAEQFAVGVRNLYPVFSGTELVWEVLNRTEKKRICLPRRRNMTIHLNIGAAGYLVFINGIQEKALKKSKNIFL